MRSFVVSLLFAQASLAAPLCSMPADGLATGLTVDNTYNPCGPGYEPNQGCATACWSNYQTLLAASARQEWQDETDCGFVWPTHDQGWLNCLAQARADQASRDAAYWAGYEHCLDQCMCVPIVN